MLEIGFGACVCSALTWILSLAHMLHEVRDRMEGVARGKNIDHVVAFVGQSVYSPILFFLVDC